MQLTIHLFAAMAQRLGTRTLVLTVPEGSTVNQLLDELENQHADFEAMRPTAAVAVNMAYVSRDTVLTEEDEVALIPPVSGG